MNGIHLTTIATPPTPTTADNPPTIGRILPSNNNLLLHLRRLLPPLVAEPRGLNKTGGPGPPLVGVEPESVPELLAVEAAELGGDELEVVGDEGEGLDFGDGLDGASGGGEDGGGAGVECPGEKLLAAEVGGAEAAGVEEAGAAAVGGVGVEMAADNEEHLVDWVAFAD